MPHTWTGVRECPTANQVQGCSQHLSTTTYVIVRLFYLTVLECNIRTTPTDILDPRLTAHLLPRSGGI